MESTENLTLMQAIDRVERLWRTIHDEHIYSSPATFVASPTRRSANHGRSTPGPVPQR
jgi:hypothetical protein